MGKSKSTSLASIFVQTVYFTAPTPTFLSGGDGESRTPVDTECRCF